MNQNLPPCSVDDSKIQKLQSEVIDSIAKMFSLQNKVAETNDALHRKMTARSQTRIQASSLYLVPTTPPPQNLS